MFRLKVFLITILLTVVPISSVFGSEVGSDYPDVTPILQGKDNIRGVFVTKQSGFDLLYILTGDVSPNFGLSADTYYSAKISSGDTLNGSVYSYRYSPTHTPDGWELDDVYTPSKKNNHFMSIYLRHKDIGNTSVYLQASTYDIDYQGLFVYPASHEVIGYEFISLYSPPGDPVIDSNYSTIVKITSPSRDDYVTTKHVQNIWAYFCIPVELGATRDDVEILVEGGQEYGDTSGYDTFEYINIVEDTDGNWWAEGNLAFNRELPLGLTELKLTVKYNFNKYMGYRTIEVVSGFVDEDGDGIDDRTGEKVVYPDLPVNTVPKRDMYSDGVLGSIEYGFDTLMYYITAPFRWIAESLDSLGEWLQQSQVWIASVSAFIGIFFGFLPDEIRGGLVMIFIVAITFTIISVLRK